MKIDDLKILNALFQDPNLTKISGRFNYSQSNLSKIIKRIEEELGFTLFERKGFQGLEPTAQGLLLAERIQNISQSWDDTLVLVKSFEERKKDLKITGPSLYMRNIFLPRWFDSDLTEKYRLTYVQSRMDQLSLTAQSSDIDLVITPAPLELSDWIATPIYNEQFAIFYSGKSVSSLKDLNLQERDWLGYKPSSTTLQSFLSKNQIPKSKVIAYIDDTESILDILEKRKNTAALLPTHAINSHPKTNQQQFPQSQTQHLYLMHKKQNTTADQAQKPIKKLLT